MKYWKQLICMLLVLIILPFLPVIARAETGGTCGENLTWSLDSDGLLVISGTGPMRDYDSPWYDIRSSITAIRIEEGVTSIGACAFTECSSLTSVTIPESLSYAAMSAFGNSNNIESVYITDFGAWMNIYWETPDATPLCYGSNLYLNGELLTDAVIPEGTAAIRQYALFHCESLETLTISQSVMSIGEGAISYVPKLKQITIPSRVELIDRFAFEGSGLVNLTVPQGVITIEDGAFQNCQNLVSISLPSTVLKWGEYICADCYNLTSVTLPNNLKAITPMMFARCIKLPSITIPESVSSIGESAFSSCHKLTSINIPNKVTRIEKSAFLNCVSMTGITIPESITRIGDQAFSDCESMTDITIPQSVTGIGEEAFSGCDSLREISFLGNAPEIGNNAFGSVTATAYYPVGNTTWTAAVRQQYGGTINWRRWDPSGDTILDGVYRLSGANRYLTGFAIADMMKEIMSVEKFETVVVASGRNFPDALTGSYLAAVKDAPILLFEPNYKDHVMNYLNDNLVPGGKVYILGGTAAVSQFFEDDARSRGYDVERLKGANRYETNLAILMEAGINENDEILITTGKNYADSLSASATGLPMLLIDDTLTDTQIAFLKNTSRKFVILGGTNAVSDAVNDQLLSIGGWTRVNGIDRYNTSVSIARRYFNNPEAAVLAYGMDFPDGLCGGPLANSIDAPLYLTSDDACGTTDYYLENIYTGIVVGGTSRISDESVREIFDLPSDTLIEKP